MTAAPAMIVEGEGPALVFLHGVGGDKRSWAGQLPVFAAAGFKAAAFDAPGYGDNPAVSALDWAEMAASVIAGLDAMGVERATLIGHSMGGMTAQEVAARAPGRVSRLVLSGTSPAFGRPDGDFQKRFVAERLGPLDAGRAMPELAREIVASLVGIDPDPAGVAAATDCMARVPDATYRAAMRNLVTFDRKDALGAIAVPCLVLAGEHDTSAPAGMMERMAGRIPRAVFACIPDAGHLANFERPDRFNAVLLDFLRTHPED